MESPSLRERKKARTRAAIADAALDLFLERGFATVTLSEVAATAEVAPRTLFRYFHDKEELLFGEDADVRVALEAALRSRADDEPAAIAVREAVVALAALWQDRREEGSRRRELIESTPALAARQRVKHAGYERMLTGALAARGLERRDAGLLARAAVMCFDEALSGWLTSEPDAESDLQAHVRWAFARLGALLEDAIQR